MNLILTFHISLEVLLLCFIAEGLQQVKDVQKHEAHQVASAPDPIQKYSEESKVTAVEIPAGENQAANATKPISCIELGEVKRTCNEGLKGLLDYVVDREDMDGLLKVAGVLTPDELTIYSGRDVVKSWKYPNIKMPIETIDERCLAIRPRRDYPDILCAPSRAYRNFWINSIHEAILCKKNGGVNGKLPAVPGPELFAEAEGVTEEEKPSGINLHIDEDENGKLPQLLINGVPAQEIAKEKKRETEELVNPPEQSPKVEDLVPDIENEPEDPNNPYDKNMRTRTFEEELAMKESEAEKNQISPNEAPPYGFLALQRLRNRTLQKLGMYRQKMETEAASAPLANVTSTRKEQATSSKESNTTEK